jgi:hypothetical protein
MRGTWLADAAAAIAGHCGYCRCGIIADVDAPRACLVRCLLSELDTTGHTDALQMLLLLNSDVIITHIELGQCPIARGEYQPI